MASQITHIETYLPEKVLTNEALQGLFPELKVKELTRLTGVHERHIIAEGETSVDMARKAAEKLFTQHQIDKTNIDFILFCSAASDYITPASACILQQQLGLSQHCGALDINQGCTGYIYGLSLADSLIKAANASCILFLTSESITTMLHPKDKSNRSIFGDGATASLITGSTSGSNMSPFIFGTDGSQYDQIIIKHGRERYPLPQYAADDFIDETGNIRNHANFYMNGSVVFNFSVEKAPVLVQALLKQAGCSFDDIDLFVFHQANQIILETIGKKLKIPGDKLVIEMGHTGNTVSSTIPFALEKAWRDGRLKRGQKILMAGFGVGFSWGGTVIDF